MKNQYSRVITGALVIGVLWNSATLAQTALINGYAALNSDLDKAVSMRSKDQAASFSQIDQAYKTYQKFARDIKTQAITDGLDIAFKNAQKAVALSDDDIQAQVGQVKSLVQRALLESMYQSMADATPAAKTQAQALAKAVGSSIGMPAASQAELQKAVASANTDAAQIEIEKYVVQKIDGSLKAAASPKKNVAYGQVANASNLFLLVQGSPRTENIDPNTFSDALTNLINDNREGFNQQVGAVTDETQTLAKTVAEAKPAANPEPPVALPSGAVKPTPDTQPAEVLPSEATPSSAETQPVAVLPSETTPTEPVKPAPAEPVPAKPVPVQPADTQPVVQPVVSKAADLQALVRELQTAGLVGKDATTKATMLAKQGVTSLQSAQDQLYGSLSEALINAEMGNIAEARADISKAQGIYEATLGPIVDSVRPELASRTRSLMEKMSQPMVSVGLRASDVTVLIGEITTTGNVLKGGDTMARHEAVAAIEPIWMGLVRAIIFIAIAIVAFYPLYLLRLAFGGRNPYWRYIGVAMILLFVPAIVEGLAYLGSIIADLSGLSFFNILTSLSVLQNPIAQIIWALTLMVACGFAIAGFRGICIQFGLIRTKNQAVTTQFDNGATATPSTPDNSKNTFEWDEEF